MLQVQAAGIGSIMDASRTVIDNGNTQLPLLQRILNRVFRCSHRHLGLPITLRGESFAACLDCGARVAYDLRSFGGHADLRKQAGTSASCHPAMPAHSKATPAKAHSAAAAKTQTTAPAKARANKSKKQHQRRADRSQADRKGGNVPQSKPRPSWLRVALGACASATLRLRTF